MDYELQGKTTTGNFMNLFHFSTIRTLLLCEQSLMLFKFSGRAYQH